MTISKKVIPIEVEQNLDQTTDESWAMWESEAEFLE
jgi:hypothetical protein